MYKHTELSEIELCMLTELSEQGQSWSPWDVWRSQVTHNARLVLNNLYRKGFVKIERESGYYYLDSANREKDK